MNESINNQNHSMEIKLSDLNYEQLEQLLALQAKKVLNLKEAMAKKVEE